MKSLSLLSAALFCSLLGLAQNNFKWTELNTGTTKNINDIYFHTPLVGYMVGDNYLFKKTTDGGETWTDLPTPRIGEKAGNFGNIKSVAFHNPTTGGQLDSALYLTWEKGYHGVLTADEGQTYKVFAYSDSAQFCEIDGFKALPANRGNGYVNMITYGRSCSNRATKYNFYDGPFLFQVSDSVKSADSTVFADAAGGRYSVMMASSDGYLYKYPFPSARPDSIFLDTHGVTSVAYAGNYTWYASTGTGFEQMYISRDTGKTFQIDSSFPPTFYYPLINEMEFITPDSGIVVASSNARSGVIIIKDTARWYFVGTTDPVLAVSMPGGGLAYVAGKNGFMMRSGTLDTTTSLVENIHPDIAVYPNPVKDILLINLPSDVECMELNVTNSAGVVVLSKTEEPGEISLEAVPTGIYFLELKTTKGSFFKRLIKY